MSTQTLDTTFKTITDRMGPSAYFVLEGKAEATTDVTYTSVPYAGKLVRALFCNGATAMAAANNYTVAVANASNSDAAMVTSVDFGDGSHNLAAYATYALTPSATAANVAVDAGDTIEITMTVQGTVTEGRVLLYFEAS